MLRTLAIALSFVLAAPALAQDEDFDLDDDIDIDIGGEEPEDADTERLQTGDDLEAIESQEQTDDDLEDFRDPNGQPVEGEDGVEGEASEPIDLLGDEPLIPTAGDSEQTYRDTNKRLERLGADEQLAGWEEYLATYPTTVYRPRIESKMDGLMTELYSGRIRSDDPNAGQVDALRAEIPFSQPMQLENINPRTRFQAGFEWGLPAYLNLIIDFEGAVNRNLSFHGGVRRRYQGWNVEGGVRWALIKSSRTKTIVSILGDFRFNTNPAHPGIRPQLAAGKIFGDKLHLQIQGGPDIAASNPVGLRIVGGGAAYYAASDTVGVFAETNLHFKMLPADGAFDGGLLAFNVVSFGMKFYPRSKDQPDAQDVEVNFGATVPYWQDVWQFHFGSVMGQANYYL